MTARTLLLLCLACTAAADDIRLAPVFGSDMVWPRDVAVPVWGFAVPGAEVGVAFASQVQRTRAGTDGAWRVQFTPEPASVAGRTLRLQAGDGAALLLTNIVVGDVWLAAGQSNMKYPLAQAKGGPAAADLGRGTLRLLRFEEGATGDAPAYTSNQLARLEPAKFFRGAWRTPARPDALAFSAVGWFFAQRILAEQPDVPLGIIQAAVGGSPAESWIGEAALREGCPELVRGSWLENGALGAWCRGRARQNLAASAAPGDEQGPNHPFKPGFLWAAGIAPLAPFPVRGVLWYQGESNAEEERQIAQHDRLFPLLVTSWRAAFGRELPFLYVQLPGMARPQWPAFRESQRRQLGVLPGVGMAVTIDLGERGNVHPADKQPVGDRLARLALAQVYGRDLLPTGPLVTSVRREGGSLRVTFANARGLTTRDGEAPRGFAVADGADGFTPVKASLDRETVVLEGTGTAVRYGWMPFPEPALNLVNGDHLPAAPFSQPAE